MLQDGSSSYDFTTAKYNDNTQANLGHTTILKNAAGNKLIILQVRKDGTDEHWSEQRSLWTHNTYSQTSLFLVFLEKISDGNKQWVTLQS